MKKIVSLLLAGSLTACGSLSDRQWGYIGVGLATVAVIGLANDSAKCGVPTSCHDREIERNEHDHIH